MEESAKFWIFSGGFVLLDGAEEVIVGPPFVADELVHEGKHGRNVADDSPTIFPLRKNRYVDTKISRSFGAVDAGSKPVLEENQIEEALEFVADLGKIAYALESDALKEREGGCVFGVDAGNHGVLAGEFCSFDEGVEEERTDSLASIRGSDMDSAFHGVTVTGPGTEIAEAGKPAYV